MPATASNHALFRIKANIGHAHVRLGDDHEGARWLLEACTLYPADPKAVANNVLAKLLLNENEDAIALARASLVADPGNELVAFYLVQACARVPRETDPLAGVPAALANRADILFSLIIFQRMRAGDTWVGQAQDARRHFPDDKRIAAIAAEADIVETVEQDNYQETYRLPDDVSARLQKAAQLLTAEWEAARSSEQQLTDEHYAPAASAMVAWKISRQNAKALLIAEQLVNAKVTNLQVLFNAAQIIADANNDDLLQEAIALSHDAPELLFLRALRLVDKGEWKEAVRIFGQVPIPPVERDAVQTIIALAPLQDPAQTVEEATMRAALPPATSDPRSLIIFARVARNRGFLDLANEAFAAARASISATSNMAPRLMVAAYAADTNDVTAVIETRQHHIPRDQSSAELLWLATAHAIQRPKRRGNLAFFETLPVLIRALPAYAKQHATVLLAMDKPADAIPILKAVRAAAPGDAYTILRLSEAFACLNDTTAGVALAQSIDSRDIEGRPEHLMAVAQLLCQHGRIEDALKLGYDVLVTNGNNARVVAGYAGLFLLDPRRRIVSTPPVVAPGTAVLLQAEDKSIRSFIIGEEEHGFWGVEARSPEAEDVKQLLAQPKGHTFSAPKRFGAGERFTLFEIKSKYLHVFHVIMDQFETRFPGHGGLWQIQSTEGDITPFLDAVRAMEESDRDRARMYTDQKMPLAFVARMMGRDVLSFAAYVRQLGHDILTCEGNQKERDDAIALAIQHRGRGASLDTYTAAVAAQIDILPALKAYFGELYVPASCISLFDRLLHNEREKLGKQPISIGWIDGQFVRSMPTDDEITAQIHQIERARSRLQVAVQVEKVLFPDDAPKPIADLAATLGGAVFEAIYLARDRANVLVSDDHRLRVFATEIAPIDRLWLQPILTAARDSKVIDQVTYSHALAGLARHRHQISLNAEDLKLAFQGKQDMTSEDFLALASRLGSKNAEMQSHAGVAIGFLMDAWDDAETAHLGRERATSIVLESIVRERTGDWPEIIGYIAAAVPSYPHLRAYIQRWLAGHFLPVQPAADACGRWRRIFVARVAMLGMRSKLLGSASRLPLSWQA